MSETTALDLSSDEVRALADLGFIALFRGRIREAEALFKGLCAARPQDDAGPIGIALLLMRAGDVTGAIKLLKSRPRSDANQTILGMALLRLGERAEAEAILRDVAATASESAHASMAAMILSSAAEDRQPLLPR
jgi:predicted Zn-dependent protease